MSSIVRCKSGRGTYLYESTSYRDEEGRPRNRRKCVGKINPVTGKEEYSPEYIERMRGTERQPALCDTKVFSVNDVKESSVREMGASRLLLCASERIGLTEALRSAIPELWDRVLALACFLVATGEPAMYCEDWMAKSEGFDAGGMSAQRIGEMLAAIGAGDRMAFFEKWGAARAEEEMFALDITSASSYSKMIGDVSRGYNRDGEDLPQVNICSLVGEKSRLPIFQTEYAGAIRDVSTLKATLASASGLGMKDITVVMDKGFASKANIDAMLGDKDGIRFLVSLPFTMRFAAEQVRSEKKDIDTVENTIVVGGDVIRGVTKKRAWGGGKSVFAHVYFNAAHASDKRDELYGRIARLREAAMTGKWMPEDEGDIKKYLCVRKSQAGNGGFTVSVRHDAVERKLSSAGWMVAVSNFVEDPREAIEIYRGKDVVEKAFCKLKNCLDMARLRVHSDNSMQNKLFVGFIALIVMSHLHNVMKRHGLYKSMTMKKMLKSLETLRVHYIKGIRIVYPMTALHKSIFKAFDLDLVL
jgi:hypothetical protein